jgi:hypothetical protein
VRVLATQAGLLYNRSPGDVIRAAQSRENTMRSGGPGNSSAGGTGLPWLVGVLAWGLTCAAAAGQVPGAQAKPSAVELDRRLLALAQKGPEAMTNLTYLSDMIGPRLTGSAALRRANDWAAARMKTYGLVNVHLEPWSLPEGWQRGTATGRILEPDNGRTLSLASRGWSPGTGGTVQGDVVALQARTVKDLDQYRGRLKNAIVLGRPPATLIPLEEIEKRGGLRPGKDRGPPTSPEETRAFQAALAQFLQREGAAVLLLDAGKHHGLLYTTGTWAGKDRPSAANRLPIAYVAHEHYALLYRLATRPAPARTRVEIAITNRFIPGPIAAYNVVGEIRGAGKPDEVVVVGAHLDSWDLGQGTLDNGTGTAVVLEAARILARCGTAPRRTIRFILFTGEEQGLHGSRAYVQQHKQELDRISACLVHDTGTGKVVGLGWLGRPALKPILEAELAGLKEVGVGEVYARGFGGSDHASFDRAGVPACMFRQEVAGYRFAHHSQADTLTLAREAGLVQGAQVMAVTAMRLANRAALLPRERAGK